MLNFLFSKKRTSIPNNWCGEWIDKNGKTLFIQNTKHSFYTVSIKDQSGNPYQIELLDDDKKDTTNLTANFSEDSNKNPVLQVEAGVVSIGPTYNLLFAYKKRDGDYRLARNTDSIKDIVILPNVGIGLYDDYEDDLGVPWAFPLEDFKKV